MVQKVKKIVLLVFFLLCFPVIANAATKGYTINTGNTTVYKDKSLKSKTGIIFDTDELVINEINDKYCKVTYPTSKGNKTGYVSRGSVITKISGTTKTVSSKITTYRRNNSNNTYGSISKGDKITILGNKGEWTQVKYPVSGGYKYAFVKKDVLSGKKSNEPQVTGNTYALYVNGFGAETAFAYNLGVFRGLVQSNKYCNAKTYSSTFSYIADGKFGTTKERLEAAIETAYKGAKSSDVAIFWLATHGEKGTGKFCLRNSEKNPRMYSYVDLLKKLKAVKCNKIIMVVEACYSGQIKSIIQNTLSKNDKKRFIVFYSADADHCGQYISADSDLFLTGINLGLQKNFLKLKYFSEFCNADTNHNGEITAKELGDYVKDYVDGNLWKAARWKAYRMLFKNQGTDYYAYDNNAVIYK